MCWVFSAPSRVCATARRLGRGVRLQRSVVTRRAELVAAWRRTERQANNTSSCFIIPLLYTDRLTARGGALGWWRHARRRNVTSPCGVESTTDGIFVTGRSTVGSRVMQPAATEMNVVDDDDDTKLACSRSPPTLLTFSWTDFIYTFSLVDLAVVCTRIDWSIDSTIKRGRTIAPDFSHFPPPVSRILAVFPENHHSLSTSLL